MAEFIGRARALSASGLIATAGSIGVNEPEIWAVLAVETSGCGFLADRRPRILYERHLFHALTNGTFDDGDLSDPLPYAKNNYDVRLNGEYQKAAVGALPDFDVRSAQLYLQFKGFDIGLVDGIVGPHTRSAIIQFQTDNGLAATGEVDQALLDALLQQLTL